MGTDICGGVVTCPLPRTAKCAACNGKGWRWNPDFYSTSHQLDCAACGTTGRVQMAGKCSYKLRGMTGMQELDALERHLRKCHPTSRESTMAVRERAEHNAASCAGV